MRWKIGSIGCSALGWHASGTAPSASGARKPREEDDDIRSINILHSMPLESMPLESRQVFKSIS